MKKISEPLPLTLSEMVRQGLVEETWDEKIKDFRYKLSEKGIKFIKRKIRNSPSWALYYFSIYTNIARMKEPNKELLSILADFVLHLKSEFGINFHIILLYAIKKGWIKGIGIREGFEPLAEELAKLNQKELMKVARENG